MSKHSLLLVAHCPSPNTRALAESVITGVRDGVEDGSLACRHVPPLEATADDVLGASGLILGTTENFGYMSGAMKDFFDRVYYPCLDHSEGLPYAIYIRAGLDGSGTQNAMERIITGLRWRAVQEPMILRGTYESSFEDQCRELGATMAAGLSLGIF